MIVLDASVLIGLLSPSDPHHEAAARLLVDLEDEQLGVSEITLAEVLVGPLRRHGHARDVRDRVVDTLGVDVLPLAPQDPVLRLAALRVEAGVRLPDCCALLSAQGRGARVATFDRRLARAAARLGLDAVPT